MLLLPVRNIGKEYPQITHTQTEREPLPIPCVIRFVHPFQAINRTHLTSNIKVRIFLLFLFTFEYNIHNLIRSLYSAFHNMELHAYAFQKK